MAQSDAAILLGYFDAVEDRFRTGVRQAHDFLAVEGIHDLRVEIKRMRAFFRSVRFLQPEFDFKVEAKPLKLLFEVAGQLRDIDIQQRIVFEGLQRHQLSEFANELKQLEFALRPALLAAIEKFQFGKLSDSRRAVAGALKAVPAEAVRDGLMRQIGQLMEQLMPLLARRSASDLELHEIRKLSKASKYSLDVWQMVVGGNKICNDVSVSLKEVYTHLGNWHDARVTAESLGRFVGRGTPRNLYDPTAYRKFATELDSLEAACLSKYRKVPKRLRENVGLLTTKVFGSAKKRPRKAQGSASQV